MKNTGLRITYNTTLPYHWQWPRVEHWDVIQEEVPASESVNGNAMFPIEYAMFPSRDEEANRVLAVSVINNVFGLGNIDMIDEVYDESYIQHNPFIPNGARL